MSKRKYIISGILGGIIIPYFYNIFLSGIISAISNGNIDPMSIPVVVASIIILGFIIQFFTAIGDSENRLKNFFLYWRFYILGLIISIVTFLILISIFGFNLNFG